MNYLAKNLIKTLNNILRKKSLLILKDTKNLMKVNYKIKNQ